MAEPAYSRSIEEPQLRAVPPAPAGAWRRNPAYQAYQVLHIAFTAAPILAGIDKFSNILVRWDQYLAPFIPRITGLSAPGFMRIVGVIEIVAGIGVALKPKIFGYVVSAWLVGIIVDLLIARNFYDIALRDFGLALGAFALGRLSNFYDHQFERSKA